MNNFYVKNKEGKYIPIELKSVLGKELDGHLVIVKVGTDSHQATIADLDMTEESFACADVLNDLNNVSVIITPYQIDVGTEEVGGLEDKYVYLQISNGGDIGMLEKHILDMYKRVKKKFDVVVLPSPLKIKDYRKVKDILKRSKIRKDRRSRVKG